MNRLGTISSLKILCVFPYPGYLRLFGSTISALSDRGHRVTLAYEKPEKRAEVTNADESYGATVIGAVPSRSSDTHVLNSVQAVADYLRFATPAFAGRPYLRNRMRKYLPDGWGFLERVGAVPRVVERTAHNVARACEFLVPPSPKLRGFLADAAPDVLVISPLVLRGPGGVRQAQIVKAARALRIPVVLAVGSWDHLSSKGLIRVQPSLTVLWNAQQKREAVEMHGLPPERVVITGAPPFDFWFHLSPAVSRDAFLSVVGLPAGASYLTYVGSTRGIIAQSTELAFVRDWVSAVRASRHTRLRSMSVLIRPHPANASHWQDVDLGEGVTIWPREAPKVPMDDAAKLDYYHSLYFGSGVVGINTSAMIEAAIVGRPVYAIQRPDLEGGQGGTDHFRYLLPGAGGPVRAAATFDEHFDQVMADLRDPRPAADAAEAFVNSFVRPLGGDESASSRTASAIESAAATHRVAEHQEQHVIESA
jgi:hypothetical protein